MVSVQLVMVHSDGCGTETYEAKFVDGDGVYGTECEVRPDGTICVIPEGDEPDR